jgi:crotonobetaine/carnitine-CoA ligase
MTKPEAGRHLHGVLEQAAAEDPDASAITFVGGECYTRGELLVAVRRVAAGLREAGVVPGDRLALFLPNRLEFVVSYLAISSLGAVSVPLNTALRGDVLDYMLDSVSPCRLIADGALYGQIRPSIAVSPGVTQVWLVSGDGVDSPGWEPFEELSRHNPLTDSHSSEPWDLASILFTSGTTGPSKGVMWSHEMALAFSEHATWVMGYTHKDTVFTCLPLYHINALFTGFFAPLQERASVVVAPRFSASTFWQEIRDHGATVTNMLGAIGAILWRQDPVPEEKEHRLRLAMVVPYPAGYDDAFRERFGMNINELYGSTDTGIPIGVPFGQLRSGSCGIASPGWEVMLVDEHDREVAAGEPGELVTRPLRPFIGQLGYWRQPDKTWEAHRNAWFHTGDILRRDEDGWFYFLDRMKDAMRVSGENVSSFEVEQVLISHPLVLEAAVFAVPSELGEDSVMGAVVVEPDVDLDIDELVDFVTPRLAYFAIPRYIEVVSELPKTSTQKVRKTTLRERGVTPNTRDLGPRRRPRA